MAASLNARVFTTSHGVWRISDDGAQVLSWLPDGGADVLWLSDLATRADGRAIRGGIPVCWPWFGPGRHPGMSPAHGFARTSTWAFEGTEERGDDLVARYVLTCDRSTSQSWPYRAQAALEVRMGTSLGLVLTVTNLDDVRFDYEEALHAYLRVSEVTSVSVDGLDGSRFVDKTAAGVERTQLGAVRFTGHVDRVYASSTSVTVSDPGLGRCIVTEKTGSASTIVWNPGPALAATMTDVPAGGWATFCCVEAGNVLDDAVALEPGESHRLDVTLRVDGVCS